MIKVRPVAVVANVIGADVERRDPQQLGFLQLRLRNPDVGAGRGHDDRTRIGQPQRGRQVDRKPQVAGCQRRRPHVEHLASGRVRTEERLGWPQWAERVNAVLNEFERLFWPDLFILGGGVTESYEEFASLLRTRARIAPARFRAQAGIVGAALAAAEAASREGSA